MANWWDTPAAPVAPNKPVMDAPAPDDNLSTYYQRQLAARPAWTPPSTPYSLSAANLALPAPPDTQAPAAPTTPVAPKPPESPGVLGSLWNTAKGGAVEFLKTAQSVGPSLYGLADTATGGYLDIGRRRVQAGLQNVLGDDTRWQDIDPIAVSQQRTGAMQDELKPDQYRQWEEDVAQQQGVWDKTKATLSHPGLLVGKVAGLAPYVLGGEAAAANVGKAGMAAGFGALMGGQSALDAQARVYDKPLEELKKLPDYRPDQSEADNRARLAQQAARPAAVLGGAAGVIPGAIAGKALHGPVTALLGGAEKVAASLPRTMAQGVLQQAPEFAAMNAGTALAGNVGLRAVDPNQALMEGVPETVAEGLLVGGLSGMGVHPVMSRYQGNKGAKAYTAVLDQVRENRAAVPDADLAKYVANGQELLTKTPMGKTPRADLLDAVTRTQQLIVDRQTTALAQREAAIADYVKQQAPPIPPEATLDPTADPYGAMIQEAAQRDDLWNEQRASLQRNVAQLEHLRQLRVEQERRNEESARLEAARQAGEAQRQGTEPTIPEGYDPTLDTVGRLPTSTLPPGYDPNPQAGAGALGQLGPTRLGASQEPSPLAGLLGVKPPDAVRPPVAALEQNPLDLLRQAARPDVVASAPIASEGQLPSGPQELNRLLGNASAPVKPPIREVTPQTPDELLNRPARIQPREGTLSDAQSESSARPAGENQPVSAAADHGNADAANVARADEVPPAAESADGQGQGQERPASQEQGQGQEVTAPTPIESAASPTPEISHDPRSQGRKAQAETEALLKQQNPPPEQGAADFSDISDLLKTRIDGLLRKGYTEIAGHFVQKPGTALNEKIGARGVAYAQNLLDTKTARYADRRAESFVAPENYQPIVSVGTSFQPVIDEFFRLIAGGKGKDRGVPNRRVVDYQNHTQATHYALHDVRLIEENGRVWVPDVYADTWDRAVSLADASLELKSAKNAAWQARYLAPAFEKTSSPPAKPRQSYADKVALHEHDDLLTAIAKLGGIDQALAKREGVDPSEFKRMPVFGKPLFRKKGGRGLDTMAEVLSEAGYPVLDETGHYTVNRLLDQLDAALRGESIYNLAGYEEMVRREAEDRHSQKEADDWTLDDVELEHSGFNRLPDAEQAIADWKVNARKQLGDDKADSLFERIAEKSNADSEAEFLQELNDAYSREMESGGGSRGSSVRNAPEEPGRVSSGESPEGDFNLSGYSQADLSARAAEVARAQAEQAAKDKAANQKAEADRARGDFVLAGSDRPADLAIARGQQELAPVPEPPKPTAQNPNAAFNAKQGKGGDAPLASRGRKIDDRESNDSSQSENFAVTAEKKGKEVKFNVDNQLFSWLGVDPHAILADAERLQAKHPEYFSTPEQVIEHIQNVLEQADVAMPASYDPYALVVALKNDGQHNSATIEFVKRGGKYRVRNAQKMPQAQLDAKLGRAGDQARFRRGGQASTVPARNPSELESLTRNPVSPSDEPPTEPKASIAQTAKNSTSPDRTPPTREELTQHLKDAVGEKDTQALLDSRRIRIHDDVSTVPEASRPPGRFAASVDKDGVAHFVLSEMDAATTQDVLAHESGHIGEKLGAFDATDRPIVKAAHAVLRVAGLEGLIGKPSFDNLVEQTRALAEKGVASAKDAQDWVNHLAEKGLLDPNHSGRELVSYTLEYAPKNLPLVKRILSTLRAALYRMGVKMQLNESDLLALARSALKSAAKEGRNELTRAGHLLNQMQDSPGMDGMELRGKPELAAASRQQADYSEDPATLAEFNRILAAQRQAVQPLTGGTDSRAFAGWFGDSVMKKRSGDPLPLYHGTSADFRAFDMDRGGSNTDHATAALGVFMTPSARDAGRYGDRTLPLYARIEKPYVVNTWDLPVFESADQARAFSAQLQAKGYDGMVIKSGADPYVVAFDGKQVKSLENQGTWSRETGDIYASRPNPLRLAQVAAEKATGLLPESAKELGRRILEEAQLWAAPMAAGTARTQAPAKDYANGVRQTWHEATKTLERLTQDFTPKQHKSMWTGMDETSVWVQQQMNGGMDRDAAMRAAQAQKVGVFALPTVQRDAALALSTRADALWRRAKDAGMVQDDAQGLPFWTPRVAAIIGEDGSFGKPPSKNEGVQNPDGPGIGFTTTSPNLKHRGHLFAADSEAGMQKLFGDQATLVRDIRVMPLAMARLEQAIAGRELINQVKAIGKAIGAEVTSTSAKPGYFTLNHPAFQTYVPRIEKQANGAWEQVQETVTDADGHTTLRPAFEKQPLYIAKEFEGPLRAVLNSRSGPIYQGLMGLKRGAMSLVMFSPMIHNAVIWGKAFPAMPGKMITGQIYFEGNRAKRDPALMKEAISNGLAPINSGVFHPDMPTGLNSLSGHDAGLISVALSKGVGLVNKNAGAALAKGLDQLGGFWHNTMLWDRVGDLQMGLYVNLKQHQIAKGLDAQSAGRVAAHFANRYAGAIPQESMGEGARRLGNLALFSRSFTLGNLAIMKDMLTGLPQDVKAQILRDAGQGAMDKATAAARHKAWVMLAADIGLMYVGNAILQGAVDSLNNDKSLDEISQGYARRLDKALKTADGNPLQLINPWSAAFLPDRLSPGSEHEPGKEGRIFTGRDPRTGTANYTRLPTGKVGEEMMHWPTRPLEMLRKKQSTLLRPTMEIFANSDHFNNPIYDADAPGFEGMVKRVGQVVGHFLAGQAPVEEAGAAYRSLTGQAVTGDTLKWAGPLMGFTAGRGYPGGPELGAIAAADRRHTDEIKAARPEIKRLVESGQAQEAVRQMTQLGMNPTAQRALIMSVVAPQARLNSGALMRFYRNANMEEKAKLQDIIDAR